MDTSQGINPRYLRIPQAATYLGLAPKTLYRLAEERRIPYIRKGRTLFFIGITPLGLPIFFFFLTILLYI